MTRSRLCGTRILREQPRITGASPAKRHRKGTGTRNPASGRRFPRDARCRQTPVFMRVSGADGERRTRTADTSIFSRVLYQLSYLAATPDPTGLRVSGADLARVGRDS